MSKITYSLFLAVLLLMFSCKTNQKTIQTQSNTQKEKELPCIDQSKINPDLNCIYIYKPVCGCDNKTYENSCVAQRNGLTKWTEGACK